MPTQTPSSPGLIRVAVCGSVDDGKSTLLGRLLAETGSLPADTIEAARAQRSQAEAVGVGDIDFSLITDGLAAEREQGITIDVAYRHLYLPGGGRAIMADSPGHEQYTSNMAVAVAGADVALLVVDAHRGIRRQTWRHLGIAALMGVGQLVVAINKMDAIAWDYAVFDQLATQLRERASQLGFTATQVVPVSALVGTNVTRGSHDASALWWRGETLLTALAATTPSSPSTMVTRFPVQLVTRANGTRFYHGTLASGILRKGDQIGVAGASELTNVAQLVVASGAGIARTGDAVAITVASDIDIRRGDVLASQPAALHLAQRFNAEIIWLHDEPLVSGRSYLLRNQAAAVPVSIDNINYVLDVETWQPGAEQNLRRNDIGSVELVTSTPLSLDRFLDCQQTGGVVICDRLSGDTVAVALIREHLSSHQSLEFDYRVDRRAREQLKGHPGRVIWFTGLSGSGKSTIAEALVSRLHAAGVHTAVLDGDSVRTGLSKDLGFSAPDRAENVRRVAEVAKLMAEAGLVVLVALISPFRADRSLAQELITETDFIEVFVDTPLAVCQQRDPKGLYQRAELGRVANMTGVGQTYEPPLHPDVRVVGMGDVTDAVTAILAVAKLQA